MHCTTCTQPTIVLLPDGPDAPTSPTAEALHGLLCEACLRPAHPAALCVWWNPEGGHPPSRLFAHWPAAAAYAAAFLPTRTVLLEWVPCALSPLGQLVPLTTPDHPAPTSAHRAWVAPELDATGAVVARPGTASSGVL